MPDRPPETITVPTVDPSNVRLTQRGHDHLAGTLRVRTEDWIDSRSQTRYRRIADVLRPLEHEEARGRGHRGAKLAGDCNAAQADEIARLRFHLHAVTHTSKAVDVADETAHDPRVFDEAVKAHREARTLALVILGEVGIGAVLASPDLGTRWAEQPERMRGKREYLDGQEGGGHGEA